MRYELVRFSHSHKKQPGLDMVKIQVLLESTINLWLEDAIGKITARDFSVSSEQDSHFL